MFELLAKVYNGKTLIGYEVREVKSNRIKLLSIEQTYGIAMANALRNVKYNEYRNSLEGTNGLDLRKLPRKQTKSNQNKATMQCLTGDTLIQFVKTTHSDYKNQRYLVTDIMNYIANPCKGKICMLCGLRRTGKTVMIKHTIYNLYTKYGEAIKTNTAYITVTETTSLAELYQTIANLVKNDYKHIFIDEITAVSGFIQSSALLADAYATSNIHIVITGTDSLVLELAGRNSLYDRYIRIDTSYIPYKEWEYLGVGDSILDYIRLGGTLVADTFYNNDKTKDYINTSIVDNIINSLLRANNRREHQRLLELEGRGLLNKAIEQAIDSANNELTIQTITDTYRNSDLGSVKQLLAGVFNLDNIVDTEAVEDLVRYKLSILKDFDTTIDEEYIQDLQDFMLDIDIMKTYTRYVFKRNGVSKIQVPLFVQSGLKYRQLSSLAESLCETPTFRNVLKKNRELFITKIIQDGEGRLLEHAVLLNCLQSLKDRSLGITQISYNGKEIDLVIQYNNHVDLYEIKRSSSIVPNQYAWLVDTEFNNYIERYYGVKIRHRIVLYLGEDNAVTTGKYKILYKNISYFLRKL